MIYRFEIFRAVYREGGFSKAAKRLGLTQSAVSQQIKALEGVFKTTLFAAADRSMPTAAGDYLYKNSGHVLAIIEDIKNGIRNLDDVVNGKIVFGMIDVAAELLPASLKKFKHKYPNVQLEATVKPSGELIKMVEDYSLDFAVTVAYDADPSFSQHVISHDSIVAITNSGSRLYKRKTIKLKDLKGEPLILYPAASYSRRLIENCFRDHGIIPTVAMEMHYPTAIISLVSQGMGIGLISELSAGQERLKGLKKIFVTELRGLRKIGIYYKKGRSLPRHTQELIDMIRAK